MQHSPEAMDRFIQFSALLPHWFFHHQSFLHLM
jgi:hypothetical protein